MQETTETIRIGIIGLDTSHVLSTMKLLHNKEEAWHVPGGTVVAAFPGGSPDFPASIAKIEPYTQLLSDEYKVAIVESPEQVAERCDAIILHSVDGRVHLPQFRQIARYRKPVFVDKPFATTSVDAHDIFGLAEQHGTTVMSTSSLRYLEALQESLAQTDKGEIIGADTFGPMSLEPTQPGFFWYGIHSVEMLFTILGEGCRQVTVTTAEHHDVINGLWSDGRIGTVRGNRQGNGRFGAVIHRSKSSELVSEKPHQKPKYASQLERIMEMFRTGKPGVPSSETLELIRFIEAANESRRTGQTVRL
ncbi:MAG: oxidoreductase [Paenibacillus sp.]|jgi:predicted dehydrogenase|nr:oxidoreductase [Paenibacillus sp.]